MTAITQVNLLTGKVLPKLLVPTADQVSRLLVLVTVLLTTDREGPDERRDGERDVDLLPVSRGGARPEGEVELLQLVNPRPSSLSSCQERTPARHHHQGTIDPGIH